MQAPRGMLGNEPRFAAPGTLAAQRALAALRVRQRSAAMPLCAQIAGGAILLALGAHLLAAFDVAIGRALPLLIVTAALACMLLAMVIASGVLWRRRLLRLERAMPESRRTPERHAA